MRAAFTLTLATCSCLASASNVLTPVLTDTGEYLVDGANVEAAYEANSCCSGSCKLPVLVPPPSRNLWPNASHIAFGEGGSVSVQLPSGWQFATFNRSDNGTTLRADPENQVSVIHCKCTAVAEDVEMRNPPCRPTVTLTNGQVTSTECVQTGGFCGTCEKHVKLRSSSAAIGFVQVAKSASFDDAPLHQGDIVPITDLDDWNSLPFVDPLKHASVLAAIGWNASEARVWVPFRVVNAGKMLVHTPFDLIKDGMYYIPTEDPEFECYGCQTCRGPAKSVGKGSNVVIYCESACTLDETCSMRW